MQYHFDHSLGRITQQISRALGKRFEQKSREKGIHMRPDQWSVLSLLYHKGPQSHNAICDLLFMDKVSVSRTIERMGKKGLVTHEVDEKDKRMRIVSLTETGRKAYGELSHLAEITIDEALKDMTTDETGQLFDSLEKIKKNLGC